MTEGKTKGFCISVCVHRFNGITGDACSDGVSKSVHSVCRQDNMPETAGQGDVTRRLLFTPTEQIN